MMNPFSMGGPSPLEIVFSFDTTGSMSSILDEVKGRLQDMIQRLQADIPGIRIGIIAHGDYCDEDVFYLTQQLDFTNNIKDLCDFVEKVEGTGGGDPDECYEYVMRKVRTEFSWTATPTGSPPGLINKILVLIGDAKPHEPEYDQNTQNIDWRDEFDLFFKEDIKIYGVQAMNDEEASTFYKEISEGTGGKYLKLDNFSNICDFLMAICYREGRGEFLMNYEAEVRSRNGLALNKDLEGMFGALRHETSNASTGSAKAGPSGGGASTHRRAPPTREDSSSSTKTLPISHITSAFRLPAPCSPIPSPSVCTTSKQNATKSKTSSSSSLHKMSATSGKIRKRPATQSKTDKNNNIKKSPGNERLLREAVTNTFFTLNDCQWSDWKEMYSMKEPTKRMYRYWCGILPSSGPEYFRRKLIFPKITSKTGLYEFSVQTKSRGRRHVVYSRIIDGENHKKNNWEYMLFGGGIKGSRRKYEEQLQKVLKRGCRVFVRRTLFSKRQVHKLEELQHYDYAWNFSDDENYRDISKDGISLSDLDTPM